MCNKLFKMFKNYLLCKLTVQLKTHLIFSFKHLRLNFK